MFCARWNRITHVECDLISCNLQDLLHQSGETETPKSSSLSGFILAAQQANSAIELLGDLGHVI